MRPYRDNSSSDASESLLRLDSGHVVENDSCSDPLRQRHRPHSRHTKQLAVPSMLRLCEETGIQRDGLARPTDRVLRKFRHSLHVLTQIARDPLVWQVEDGTVLSDLRETLHLTESALRQFEISPDEPAETMPHRQTIVTLANLVEDRMDRLFDRIERLTALRQSLFRLRGIGEALPTGQLPRVHDIEELITTLVDVTLQDDWSVTLLDPDSTNVTVRVAAHSINVAQVVVRLAGSVSAWRAELALAVGAALLMDLGMLRLPADMLESSDLLSAPQRILLQEHPEHSAAIVRQIHGHDERWVEAVRQHHERLDGSGYPRHARGSSVGPVARLLAVADTYVGIQSPRVYRPALSSRQALVEIDRAAMEGRLDPAWTCRLSEIETHWLKIPTAPEPPSSAPACSALAA